MDVELEKGVEHAPVSLKCRTFFSVITFRDSRSGSTKDLCENSAFDFHDDAFAMLRWTDFFGSGKMEVLPH
jgi:hypothetical protein